MSDQPDILFLLHDVGRHLRLDADRRAACYGLTRAQWVILFRLNRQPGLTQKELAELLEVEPITVARLIDRLEERGMVERRADPGDRRVWRLHLLPPARPVLDDMLRERAAILARTTFGLDAETIATVVDALCRIKANVIAGAEGTAPARHHGGRLMSQATVNEIGRAPRSAAATPLRRRLRARVLRPILMLGGIVVVAVASGVWWLASGRVVSIDNAYVRAGKLSVATDVPGIVQQVAVREGERVRQGEVLYRLDPRPFEIALDGAKANLAQVALQMDAAKRDYQRMLSDVEARQAQVQSDQANFDRYANLVKGGGVTRAEYDDARFRLAADQATVESLKVQAEVQLARLGGDANVDVHAHARIPQGRGPGGGGPAPARPHRGARALRRHRHPGGPGPARHLPRRLGRRPSAWSPPSHVWIEANPKETDLTYVKPGDPVTFTVDTYPGRTWHGTVESIAPNSGSEFSILPAQNSSGNWVKVVQRIPLRVRVDRRPGDPELRAGMSVIVDIDTGHVRRLSDLIP